MTVQNNAQDAAQNASQNPAEDVTSMAQKAAAQLAAAGSWSTMAGDWLLSMCAPVLPLGIVQMITGRRKVPSLALWSVLGLAAVIFFRSYDPGTIAHNEPAPNASWFKTDSDERLEAELHAIRKADALPVKSWFESEASYQNRRGAWKHRQDDPPPTANMFKFDSRERALARNWKKRMAMPEPLPSMFYSAAYEKMLHDRWEAAQYALRHPKYLVDPIVVEQDNGPPAKSWWKSSGQESAEESAWEEYQRKKRTSVFSLFGDIWISLFGK